MHAAKINAAGPTQIRSGNSFIDSIVKEAIAALCKSGIAESWSGVRREGFVMLKMFFSAYQEKNKGQKKRERFFMI